MMLKFNKLTKTVCIKYDTIGINGLKEGITFSPLCIAVTYLDTLFVSKWLNPW